ncbi:MAG TPA: hypothetical protein VF647_07365 [Longimicrobium sp.]|jgi:hypothetical protein
MRNVSVLLLSLAAACAPAATTTTTDSPAPAPAAPTAAPAAWRTGNYSATVTAANLPAGAPADELAGAWEIQFHEGNHFIVMRNGAQMLQGHYQVSDGRLSFGTGETGPYACNVAASYTWRTTGTQTTFSPVGTDSCMGRAVILGNRAFSYSP